MATSKWDYYQVGEAPPCAGLVIIDVVFTARLQTETKYLIEHLCCHTQREMTHKQINERMRRARSKLQEYGLADVTTELQVLFCTACSRRRKGDSVVRRITERRTGDTLPPPKIKPPGWAVPKSVKGQRFIWGGVQR